MPLIQATHLVKEFPTGSNLFRSSARVMRAVDNVSFSIERNETLGLVGASGSGKSTTGRLLLRLIEPTRGSVVFDNQNVVELGKNELRRLRRKMQIIFQDPYAALNPRRTVFQTLKRPFNLEGLSQEESESNVYQLLAGVNLTPVEKFANRYPHQLSGGQRQRVVIARAIALKPAFVVADEPVSSLDLSTQVQILKLLQDLQKRSSLSLLFISHDLGVVRLMSQRIAVMYRGRIIESADSTQILADPLHPYTKFLIAMMPHLDPKESMVAEKQVQRIEPTPSPDELRGCKYYLNCPYRMEVCKTVDPPLTESSTGHHVACHLWIK